jgi:hypothetical protein
MNGKLSIIIIMILVTAAILTVQSSSMLQISYAQTCPDGSTPDASGNCPTLPPPAGDGETTEAPPPPAGDGETTEAPPPATETPPPAAPPATETPPPAAPPAAASQESNNTNFVNTILGMMNGERAAVGVPPLVWSDKLAADSQTWAEHLATLNKAVHATDAERGPFGETLAVWTHGCGLSSLVPPLDYTKGVCPGDTLRTMVMSWVNEKTLYHGEILTSTNFLIWGHYTQVVWRTTTEIGCGMATGSNGNDYLVCQYTPPGNIIGQPPY